MSHECLVIARGVTQWQGPKGPSKSMTKRSYIDHNIISQIIIFRKITVDMVESLHLKKTPLPEDYFAFWVFISIAWSFVATFVIIVLPIYESMDDIQSIFYYLLGKEPSKTAKTAKGKESTADLWVEPRSGERKLPTEQTNMAEIFET